jgi:hypothetical protein
MRSVSLLLIASVSSAFAQAPDVVINAELRPMISAGDQKASWKMYDLFRNPSLVKLQLTTEQGLVIRLANRFARYPNDRTNGLLEHAYIEMPGFWRSGYIDLPFGRKNLIREYGPGGEIKTQLLIDNADIVVAGFDNGDKKSRGVIGRLGSKVGFSFAAGNRLATGAMSLTNARDPDRAPNPDRGYRQIYGLDFGIRKGPWFGNFEGVVLRDGETDLDQDDTVFDILLGWQSNRKGLSAGIGWTRSAREDQDFFRFQGEYPLDDKSSLSVQAIQGAKRNRIGIGLVIRL